MDHLVFHPDRPEVLAVLGWKFATVGDPMCDLANNCMSFFLPAHFGARRGTEGAQAPLAHAEEPEFRSAPARAARLSSGAQCSCKGLWVCIVFPFTPAGKLGNSFGWESCEADQEWFVH